MIIFIILAGWATSGVIGYFIARAKGRDPTAGCLWGVFLGPIGWLIVALSEDQSDKVAPDGRPLRKCPYCAEMVLAEARICKHCHKDLPQLVFAPAAPPDPKPTQAGGLGPAIKIMVVVVVIIFLILIVWVSLIPR